MPSQLRSTGRRKVRRKKERILALTSDRNVDWLRRLGTFALPDAKLSSNRRSVLVAIVLDEPVRFS
jgi:hypothetical protein